MALCECGCGQDAGVYKSRSSGVLKGAPKRFVDCGHASKALITKTHCIRGHCIADVGRDSIGKCRACVRERANAAHKANPNRARNTKLKLTYGITLEERDAQVKIQGNACAICGNSFGAGKYYGPQTDHDHMTQQVRGQLCGDCNNLLGRAKDNVEILQKAIAYLLHYKETQWQSLQS